MLFADFKAQNIFEIKLVEVTDYNSTNQDPLIPKMTSKGIFLTLKKCQAKLVSVRLNEKKLRTNPDKLNVLLFLLLKSVIKNLTSLISTQP